MIKKLASAVAVIACTAAMAIGTALPAAAQDTQTTITGVVVGGTAERIDFSDPNHKGLGDALRYDFTITNTRSITMYFYPNGGNFDGWKMNNPVGTCTLVQRTLKPGETFSCWMQHTITQADLDAGSYKPDSSWRMMASYSSKVGFVPGVPVAVR